MKTKPVQEEPEDDEDEPVGGKMLNRSSNQHDLQRDSNLHKYKAKDSDDSSDDDHRAMDIGALRKQREEEEANRGKKKLKSDSDNEGYEEDFN